MSTYFNIKTLENDEKAIVPGKVAGKPVTQVMLDTGADTTVISSDLIPPGTPTDRTLIVKGLGSGWMLCPYVKIPVHAKGETVELRALVMPRSIVGRDVLLGRDTLGLEYNWWINAAGLKPALPPPVVEELPVQVTNQHRVADNCQEPTVPSPVTEELPEQAEPIPQNIDEPEPQMHESVR